MKIIGTHTFELDKVLWLQEEGLIGCLLLMNYHHPRCVMRCLLALDRIIERNGQPSGIWS